MFTTNCVIIYGQLYFAALATPVTALQRSTLDRIKHLSLFSPNLWRYVDMSILVINGNTLRYRLSWALIEGGAVAGVDCICKERNRDRIYMFYSCNCSSSSKTKTKTVNECPLGMHWNWNLIINKMTQIYEASSAIAQ